MTLSHEAGDKLMREFQVFVAESTPSDLARPRYSVPVIEYIEDHLNVSLFSGPFCQIAADAFSTSIERHRNGESAFREAAMAVDNHFKSLSEDDKWCQGWSGTAWGIFIHLQGNACRLAWQGDDRAINVRNGAVLHETSPHTVYQTLKDAGHQKIEKSLRHVSTRWLSQNHPVDSTRWDLQNGDFILLCSRFVYDSMIPTKLERFTPRRLAESLVENARQAEPRFSHVVLAIEMNRIAPDKLEQP